MSVQNIIESKIREALLPSYLEVINESHMHNVPPGSESHFKVIVVSDVFESKNRVERHQTMNALLAAELAGPVHALSMQTMTPQEWTARGGQVMQSPECLGGSKTNRRR